MDKGCVFYFCLTIHLRQKSSDDFSESKLFRETVLKKQLAQIEFVQVVFCHDVIA